MRPWFARHLQGMQQPMISVTTSFRSLAVVALIVIFPNVLFHIRPMKISSMEFHGAFSSEMSSYLGVIFRIHNSLPESVWYIQPILPIQQIIPNLGVFIDFSSGTELFTYRSIILIEQRLFFNSFLCFW